MSNMEPIDAQYWTCRDHYGANTGPLDDQYGASRDEYVPCG